MVVDSADNNNLQENVDRPDDLYEGPQSSWLGYLALADRVNIGDYAEYIEQVKNTVVVLNLLC